jgi:glycosyltransferase involved in cell wall biosynthesis
VSEPAVAIVTRTQDRPIALDRTIRDILSQSFTDWQWVVVSDAGNLQSIKGVLSRYSSDLAGRYILVHRERSEGGGAASNSGVVGGSSRYIVIHDDDDTWHPEFLQKTVTYLRKADGRVRAVATGAEIVVERLESDRIVELRRRPMPAPVQPITVSALRKQNFFPPIAFLYDREAAESIGHYRTDIPLLTDWDFFVRFAERFEIGYVEQVLAYWHRRKVTRSQPRVYSNYSYRRNLDILMKLKREWGMLPPLWRYLLWWRY